MTACCQRDDMTQGAGWAADPASGELPPQLLDVLREALPACGRICVESPSREAEGAEYGACRFAVAGKRVAFRVAKTTPAKLGQFVTLWRRPFAGSEIAPLDAADAVDVAMICVFDDAHRGLFVFDRQTLLRRGVMSMAGQGGKRAMRVYPPWTQPQARQAALSQKWQLDCFLPLPPGGEVDAGLLRRLLGIHAAETAKA